MPPKRIPPDDPGSLTSLAQGKVHSPRQSECLPQTRPHRPWCSYSLERLVQPSFSHRSSILHARGRRDACVTTRQTEICLRHRITCLSRYFAQSVCMGAYGVWYSLSIIYSWYHGQIIQQPSLHSLVPTGMHACTYVGMVEGSCYLHFVTNQCVHLKDWFTYTYHIYTSFVRTSGGIGGTF